MENLDIKNAVSKTCAETNLKWPDDSPLVLMHWHNLPNCKHGLTPHEIMFGIHMYIGTLPPQKLATLDLVVMMNG